jgi:hypothetical protein
MSLIESATNLAVGFGVALLTQALLFPLFGFHASAREHVTITIVFTVVSFVRSYALRRFFNRFVRRVI